MNIRKIFFSFLSLFIIFGTYKANAATTGIIDPSNIGNFKVTILNAGLAGNNVINFGKFTAQPAYNITVTSTELRGYAWGEGVGWIVFNCADTTSGCSGTNGNFKVSNTTSGVLSGYAWGENTGWINFGPFTNPAISTVKINTTNGLFGGSLGATGYAWSQNYGWIMFDCSNAACVETSWRPVPPPPPVTPGVPVPPPPPPAPVPPPTPTLPTPRPPAPDLPPPPPDILPPRDTDGDGDTTPPDTTPPFVEPTNPPPPPFSGGSLPDGAPRRDITSYLRDGGERLFILGEEEFVLGESTFSPVQGFGVAALPLAVLIPAIGVQAGVLLDAGFQLIRLWHSILLLFGLRKKTRPWGTVYDSQTKQPLDPVYLTLFDNTGAEVASAITDMDGRFGFLVKPGTYRIEAKKSNYTFPSSRLKGRSEDELYSDLYFGEFVEVREDGEVLIKNIPLDQIAFDWNEFAKADQKRLTYFNKRDVIVARISEVIFILGFIFALYSFFSTPIFLFGCIVALYVVIYFVRRKNLYYKIKGSVFFQGVPVPFGIVRFLSLQTGQEIAHKVTTVSGQYYAILPNGVYRIIVSIKREDGGYDKKEVLGNAMVKKGYYKERIEIM